ncbi:hypothetical protein Trydic_g10475 [Trypoxylus dichotomus]
MEVLLTALSISKEICIGKIGAHQPFKISGDETPWIIMPPIYTNNELVDMLIIYGEARHNAVLAARLYSERYPERQHPVPRSFVGLVIRLRGTGEVKTHRGRGGGLSKSERVLEAEEEIIKIVEDDDATLSTRTIARKVRVSRNTVWRALREAQSHSCGNQSDNTLTREDRMARVQFCRWFVERCEANVNFASNILITDESSFTSNEIYEFRNANVLSAQSQHFFSVNVWLGILNGALVGPFILPSLLTGKRYLYFLINTLPELLENVPLNIRRDMWLFHDGTYPHFNRKVRRYLRNLLLKRRITRRGHVYWPPKSPDLNPVNFYLRERIKHLVYWVGEVNDEQELKERMERAAARIRKDNLRTCYDSWLRRARLCIEADGRNFEHLL